jgi:hypothetical protein
LTPAVVAGVIRTPMKQRQSQPRRRRQPDTAHTPSFESAPWSARELVLEELPRAPETPLQLAQNDHLVAVELDGYAIVRDKL